MAVASGSDATGTEERSFVAALLWMTAKGGLAKGRENLAADVMKMHRAAWLRFFSALRMTCRWGWVVAAALRAYRVSGNAGLGKAVAEPPHSKSSWRRDLWLRAKVRSEGATVRAKDLTQRAQRKKMRHGEYWSGIEAVAAPCGGGEGRTIIARRVLRRFCELFWVLRSHPLEIPE